MSTRGVSPWVVVCGGLVLGLGLPELRLAAVLAPGDIIGLARETEWWAIGALMIAYVLVVERRPLTSIGIRRPSVATFLFGAVAAVLLLVTIVLSYSIVLPLLGLQVNEAALDAIVQKPMWFQLLLFARTAVIEEVIYRGYIIERIEELSGCKWLAFVISVVAFTVGHLASWGAAHLIFVGLGAVVLGLLYLWRRDLLCNMTAHFLADVVAIFGAAAE